MKCHGFGPDVQTHNAMSSDTIALCFSRPCLAVCQCRSRRCCGCCLGDASCRNDVATTLRRRQTRAGALECTAARVCSRDVVSRPPPVVRRWVRIHLPSSPRARAIGLVAASYVSDGQLQVKDSSRTGHEEVSQRVVGHCRKRLGDAGRPLSGPGAALAGSGDRLPTLIWQQKTYLGNWRSSPYSLRPGSSRQSM